MAIYTPHTEEDVRSMLKTVGVRSLKQLYKDIPDELKTGALKIPKGVSQQEAEAALADLAAKNKAFKTVLRGAGAYSHYVPAVVRDLSRRSEFLTAYTPYQAELSQGILQSIFEYQTMICRMTGLDASNASLYDGATAAAEAALMCQERGRSKLMVAKNIRPDTLEVLKTYLEGKQFEIVFAPEKDGLVDIAKMAAALDETYAAVYIEQPAYTGLIEDPESVGKAVKGVGAKFIMGCYPFALAVLKKPSECGADIAVGDGQPFGLGLAYGGPYLGFIAAKKELQRKLPGRIAGETVDKNGKKAYVLTLQAREQHIRREKASSNVCTNQAHCALTAAMYMSTMGDRGIKETAEICISGAHYLKDLLERAGLKCLNKSEFFNEFVTTMPVPADKILDALAKKDILGGLPILENQMLWCVTETANKKALDLCAKIVKSVLEKEGAL